LLPFEFFEGYTYDIRDAKTIAGKSERSGWGKRQATIIFYIMANGDTSFRPVVIFHGKGIIASRENYNLRVNVYFNEIAYNNEELFSQWLKDVYIPYIKEEAKAYEENMLVMNVATFHKTKNILALLKANGVLPAIISDRFTNLL
jgi:hypothetical protein